MKPVVVSIDVPQERTEVFAFLDDMTAHQAFTDHMLKDWSCSGPRTGVGSKAHVTAVIGGRREPVDIEVVEAVPGTRITERNVGAGGRRVAHGTYVLTDRAGGGTHVAFEYAWQQAPAIERALAPLVRATMRKALRQSMARLATTLAARPARPA